MDTFISPNHKRSDLVNADVYKKMEIFKDKVNGWQLDIAEQCCKIKHSGFAVLSIVISYFEMISAFRKGNTNNTTPCDFKDGLISVFPHLACVPYDKLGDFYRKCRCGVYHVSMVRSNILLDGSYNALDFDNGVWKINPEKLVVSLKENLEKYLADLRNDEELRKKFESAFDQITPPLSTSQTSSNNIPLPSGVYIFNP